MVAAEPTAVAIGECMLELSRSDETAGTWRMGDGGDTFNVATYLARLGVPIGYLTALGLDGFSQQMRGRWESEGIDTSLVLSHPTRIPGLYAIETDGRGERSFTYWRDASAAKALLECDGIDTALARAAQVPLLYLSAITLSLFGARDRDRLVTLCRTARAAGNIVAFDTNYRAHGWPDAATARHAVEAIAPYVTIALPTFCDDAALFNDRSPQVCAERWRQSGADHVVVKIGADGALLATGSCFRHVTTQPIDNPVDTTGAGDAFNAGFLAALLAGLDPVEAVRVGHRLAIVVISHRGAIIPRDAMPCIDLAA